MSSEERRLSQLSDLAAGVARPRPMSKRESDGQSLDWLLTEYKELRWRMDGLEK